VLYSNTAVRIESDILHFEWQWETKFFEQNDPAALIDNLNEFQSSGISAPTLNDINHIKVKSSSGFNYLFHIIGFILSTLATAIVAIAIIFLMFRFRNQITNSYDLCCTCIKCVKRPAIDPIGPEDVPLREVHQLPRYSYQPADRLYPPSD
jgi:hypothetical protein